MIGARWIDRGAFVRRLAAKAALLTKARAQSRGDAARWRRAAWLWPLFARDDR